MAGTTAKTIAMKWNVFLLKVRRGIHLKQSYPDFCAAPEPKSVTAFSILIRLCILLVIGVILRLICIFCGCCKNGFRLPNQSRDHRVSRESSSVHSVAGSLSDERSFNDTPPPYPGTPVQRIVRSLLATKSETPPPSYKQAVQQKISDASNADDISSKDSSWWKRSLFVNLNYVHFAEFRNQIYMNMSITNKMQLHFEKINVENRMKLVWSMSMMNTWCSK